MLHLRTEKADYFYCSFCRRKMTVFRSNGGIFSAVCPEWKGPDGDKHCAVLTWENDEAMRKYVYEVFGYTPCEAKEKLCRPSD